MAESAANMDRNGTGRTAAFDALRFFAALFVVVYHYGAEAPVDLGMLPILGRGYLATDFFLMLSGFILARAYGGQVLAGAVSAGGFLLKRVLRLWPAHAIVLTGLAVLYLVCGRLGLNPHHAGRFEWRDFLPQLFLVQAWADVGGKGWNLPSWSLSALIPCYLLFPFAWRWIARARSPYAPVLAMAALMVAMDLTCRGLVGRGLYDLPFSLGVVRALPIFLLGCGVAWLSLARPLPGGAARAVTLVAGVALLAVQFLGRFDGLSVALIAVVIMGCGSFRAEKPIPAAEAAGKLSFSLFITHVPFAVIWFGVVHDLKGGGHAAWLGWTIWAVSIPAAILAAWLFDRIVDQPVQRLIARLRGQISPRRDRYPALTPSA